MSERYSFEKAKNEAEKMKDLVGSHGEQEDYEIAEKMIDEEREASEKETKKLAGELTHAIHNTSIPTSLEKMPGFDVLRPGINNALKTLKRFGSYNIVESEFPEKHFDVSAWYENIYTIRREYLSRRLGELNIKSQEDVQKGLEDGTLTAESFKGDIEDIFITEWVPDDLRARFFYSKAVDNYTRKHPQIRENLPKEYSSEERGAEGYGFQKPYIQVIYSPRIDLSNELPFPNPEPMRDYNPDNPNLVLYPALTYKVSHQVVSAYSSPNDSGQEPEFGNNPSDEYTHLIKLEWYTSLARAASETQETIKRTKLTLESGESSVERYKQSQNEQLQKERAAEKAGAFKLYRFESFDRDTESRHAFMVSGEGTLINPTEEENLSEGRSGKKDRSKGITRAEKKWRETPTGVSVISYEVTRNKARTRIMLHFKLEVPPPSGLSNMQRNAIGKEIERIAKVEHDTMPKVYAFNVELDDALNNFGVVAKTQRTSTQDEHRINEISTQPPPPTAEKVDPRKVDLAKLFGGAGRTKL